MSDVSRIHLRCGIDTQGEWAGLWTLKGVIWKGWRVTMFWRKFVSLKILIWFVGNKLGGEVMVMVYP